MWITIQKQLKIKYFEDKFGYVRNLEYERIRLRRRSEAIS